MSSFVPVSALGLLLGGCMRIYVDPELPDVVAAWEAAFSCTDAVGDVRVELRDHATDELRFEATTACADGRLTLPDLARERYRVRGYLLDRAGEIYDGTSAEVDLRNGLGERVDLYWSGYANLVVAWTFPDGASCASLAADVVMIEELREGVDQTISVELCTGASAWLTVIPGRFQLRLRALGTPGTIAVSEPTPILDVAEMARTDAGTLVLVGLHELREPQLLGGRDGLRGRRADRERP